MKNKGIDDDDVDAADLLLLIYFSSSKMVVCLQLKFKLKSVDDLKN